MAKKDDKTNVMRLLDQKKIPYTGIHFEEFESTVGEEIAAYLGEDPDHVFKTLVTVGRTGQHYVFVVPVTGELDLKKAAAACGEKNIEMIRQKDLLPLTGYIHGGCSPIGMKKFFPTYFHKTAETYEQIYFSAGKVGHQVCLDPRDLPKIIRISYADLII